MSMLNLLLEDYKKYITTNTGFHSGNLYQHSIWCAIYINEMFTGECKDLPELSRYVEGISESEKTVLIIAGLLHDIGKGGDNVFNFFDKPNHPSIGGEFYTNTTPPNCYKLSDGTCIDFTKMIEELGLQDSYSTIGFLIRWHWFIGECIRDKNSSSKTISQLLVDDQNNILSKIKWSVYKEFNKACQKSNIKYEDRKELFRKLYVIWVADILATRKCPCQKTSQIQIKDVTIVNQDEPHGTHSWKYEDLDVKNTLFIRDYVLKIFDIGFETPDFSQEIIKYRRHLQVGELFYKDSNCGNPFIMIEVPKPSATPPLPPKPVPGKRFPIIPVKCTDFLSELKDDEKKAIESYESYCYKFLKQGSDPMTMDIFIGFPTVITTLKERLGDTDEFKRKLSSLYGIIANDNAEFVCSFTSRKKLDEILGADMTKYIRNVNKDTILYHGRVSYGACIIPNISNDGPFWLFLNKNNTHKYAIDRTTNKFPENANPMCWSVLTYRVTNDLKLLDLSSVEVRNKLREVFRDSHCQSWFWNTSTDYPFQDKEEIGKIPTIKHLIDLLFPKDDGLPKDDFWDSEDDSKEKESLDPKVESKEKKYTRWSHVIADKVLVKNLRDMFGDQIDGWYIPDIGALDEEICIFRPADNLIHVKEEFLDANRLHTVLERCTKAPGKTELSCKGDIQNAFKNNKLFCVHRDNNIIECYLPDEFTTYLNNLGLDKIDTLLKSGDVINMV